MGMDVRLTQRGILSWPRTQLWQGLTLLILTILDIITISNAADSSKALLKLTPKFQKVADHDIATFSCDTPLLPVPPIYWRRNGRPITNTGGRYQIFRTFSGSVLRVEPVRLRDDALFECFMDDGVNIPYSDDGRLRVYTKEAKPKGYPKIRSEPTLRVVEEDTVCIMTCEADGDPAPDVYWIKDYVPVDMDTFRYRLVEGGSLEIGYTGSSDEGTYECVAHNDLGIAYSQPARLIVEEYSWP